MSLKEVKADRSSCFGQEHPRNSLSCFYSRAAGIELDKKVICDHSNQYLPVCPNCSLSSRTSPNRSELKSPFVQCSSILPVSFLSRDASVLVSSFLLFPILSQEPDFCSSLIRCRGCFSSRCALWFFQMSSIAPCHQMSPFSFVSAIFPFPRAYPCHLFTNTFLFPHVLMKTKITNKETTTAKTLS